MAEVASTFVSVVPSARGFGRSLDSQIGGDIDGSGKRAGSRFGAALKVGALAAVGAGALLGKFVGGAIGDASDLAQAPSKVGVVFGKSASLITNASKTSATALGLTKGAYLGATGSLGNLLVSLDIAPKAAANMSATMVQLATDMASFNNVPVDEALAAIQSGLTGETEPLKRFGVNMNEATLKQQALKDGLIKTTKEALTPQQKALAAQSLILKQTGTAQGDFARTSGGLANQQKILGAQFGNLKTTIGTALLPVATKFVTFLNGLGPVFSRIGTTLAPVKAAIAGFFASFSGGGGQVSGVLAKFTAIGSYLGANLIPIFQRVGAIIATQVVPIIMSLGRFMVGTLYPAFLRIAIAVGRNLKPVLDALFAVIRGSVIPAMQGLLVKFRQAQPTIQRVISVVVQVIGTVLRMASAITGKVLPTLIRFAGFLIRNVVRAVSAGISIIVKIIGIFFGLGAAVGRAIGTFVRFSNAVDSNIRSALRIIGSIPGRAKSALGNLGSTLYSAGADLISGLARGIGDKIGAAIDAVRNGLSKIKGLLPGSPIKYGPLKSWNNQGPTGPGGRLIGNLIAGIDSQAPALEASMTRLTSRVAVPRANFSASLSATGTNAAGGRSVPTVHIEQMVTHDPYAAAYALRTEQAKALTLAGMP